MATTWRTKHLCSFARNRHRLIFGLSGIDKKVKTWRMLHDIWGLCTDSKKHGWNFKIMFCVFLLRHQLSVALNLTSLSFLCSRLKKLRQRKLHWNLNTKSVFMCRLNINFKVYCCDMTQIYDYKASFRHWEAL